MKADNILETIGNTPHIRINRLYPGSQEVWVKLEKTNPGGSIKDRIALAMVNEAERKGLLKKGGLIIEPTSGNTGIGLAMVAAVRGYRLILVMPESMSVERRAVVKAYGAEIELTPREQGMKGSISRALELLNENEGSWMPSQFENPANPEVHMRTTALEILNDFPDGFDHLVTGVGTGGHLTGVAQILKEKFPRMKVWAVEPALSPVIGGGSPGPHPLMGIGAGFIPRNLNTSLIDSTINVEKDEAYLYARRAASEEGLFVGISSGASLAAVGKLIPDLEPGARILTFCYDTGERYLSVNDLF
ncbi:MAG: cysteine synthase A [Bacteroidota bacterium]